LRAGLGGTGGGEIQIGGEDKGEQGGWGGGRRGGGSGGGGGGGGMRGGIPEGDVGEGGGRGRGVNGGRRGAELSRGRRDQTGVFIGVVKKGTPTSAGGPRRGGRGDIHLKCFFGR